LSDEPFINVSEPKTWVFSVEVFHTGQATEPDAPPPRQFTVCIIIRRVLIKQKELYEFASSGLTEFVTLNCLKHGAWSEVAIKALHEEGSVANLFASDNLFGLGKNERTQAELRQLHEMLINVYLAWV
jgi:hypothetical protein